MIFLRRQSKGSERLLDEHLYVIYEIERTIAEIRQARYRRIALQFPDSLLPDAPRVFDALSEALRPSLMQTTSANADTHDLDAVSSEAEQLHLSDLKSQRKLYILGDTSYGACCVDEIAAEHVNADVVVHYGRACLSPTARLPVVYVFTRQPLANTTELWSSFASIYPEKCRKVILMADVTYQHRLPEIAVSLRSQGYENLYEAEIQRDPSSPLPNRTVPEDVRTEPSQLRTWDLFHVSEPPQSLLLTLSSRVASIHTYPTDQVQESSSQKAVLVSSMRALNRRYALLISISTVSIFGILINTLSVKNYLHVSERVKEQISKAGKKSYTFVVGKVNAAKVANFSEIGAWVVIGCWESSLIDSKDFWRPIVTPFELELALQKDSERQWTGEWSSDYQKLLDAEEDSHVEDDVNGQQTDGSNVNHYGAEYDSEPESAPPEFDLRSGRYVSQTKPMQPSRSEALESGNDTTALQKRPKGDIAVMAGRPSPGAEYLRNNRTWKGLGSDADLVYEDSGSIIEEGRSGIARGYTHPSATSQA